MNEFKPHDYFHADDQGYISRKVFIEKVRGSYDHMRELATYIKGYDDKIDEYLQQWDQNLESLDDSIIGLLKEWIDDSTFATVINEEIFKTKADQVDLEKVTAQLAQIESENATELTEINQKISKANELTRDELGILGGDVGNINGINSWWTSNLVTENEDFLFNTFTDNVGGVWVNKQNKNTREKELFRLMSNEIDDHNAPSVSILNNGHILVFYSRHNADNLLRYRISETPYNLDFATEQTIDMGGIVTYAQVVVTTQPTNIWVLTRVGSYQWRILMSEDNFTTVSLNKTFVDFGAGNQGYLKLKYNPSSHLIRFAFVGHPTIGEVHSVYYCYMRTQDSASGIRSDIVSGGESLRNVMSETWTPLQINELATVYNSDVTGKKARLFDIGLSLNIAFIEFTTDTDGMYKLAFWNGSGFTIRDIAPAGKTIGGGSNRFYYGGAIIENRTDATVVYLSRFVNEKWRIEKWQTYDNGSNWTTSLIEESDNFKLFRPHVSDDFVSPAKVLYSKGEYAENNYTNYRTNIISRYV